MYEWNRPPENGMVSGAEALVTRFDEELGNTSGLTEGTEVATNNGWVPVEDLRPGDTVLTFDSGMQKLRDVKCEVLWSGYGTCPEAFWPLYVPAGTVGNSREMVILPDQAVLVETAVVSDMHGDPFAMIPGLALEVLPGVERQPPTGVIETFRLVFDADELVFGEHGALLHCQPAQSPLQAMLSEEDDSDRYHVLPFGQARLLMQAVASGQVKLEEAGLSMVA